MEARSRSRRRLEGNVQAMTCWPIVFATAGRFLVTRICGTVISTRPLRPHARNLRASGCWARTSGWDDLVVEARRLPEEAATVVDHLHRLPIVRSSAVHEHPVFS